MDPRCPACGETEQLDGARSGDDIEITCRPCGHHWLRGGPRCRSCGGEDVEHRLQLMRRQPRGNQVAVVGHRDVPLCPRCDAGVLGTGGDSRTIPEGYISTFVFGREEERARPAPRAAPRPATRAPSRRAAAPPPRQTGTPRPSSASRAARRPPPGPPTVREAVDAYMGAADTPDALTMLMLGRHLGPVTRLSELEKPGAAEALQQWFSAQWGRDLSAPRTAAAAAAVVAAVDHWRAQGWLEADPVAWLRASHGG